MRIQTVVSRRELRWLVVLGYQVNAPGEVGGSMVVCGRPAGLLLVEHYEREQYGLCVEREPEQRQREQQY